ncbi:MAG TPA: alpha/beta hydrolase [Gammaproteobacteria bacterium]
MKRTRARVAVPPRGCRAFVVALLLAAGPCFTPSASGQPSSGADGTELLTIDHYVRHVSTAPALESEIAQLYVRERVAAGVLARTAGFGERVVLFVHGAGTPAEVAFDVPHEDYSWMAYLAAAGYDVFSMDMTGYGRSTRPLAMNDPCNLAPEAQRALIPRTLDAECEPSRSRSLTTIASDWDDIDAVVEYLRALRGVERISLIGWSQGGPRAGGYAARHPEKVARIVLLAPAYTANSPADPPTWVAAGAGLDAAAAGGAARAAGRAASEPATDVSASARPADAPAVMTSQSQADFVANWDRQVGCADQYDPAVAAAVWSEMLASDPVGATWGPGVRRAPRVPVWGWNRDVVSRTQTPMLLVAGVHDGQVNPDRVRLLYEHLGSPSKVLLDLGCASHNAMWERVHGLLFRASLEWLDRGTVDGMERGVVRLGYE